MKFEDIAWTVGLAAVGTIVAGLIMSYTRGTIPIIAKAHTGFDS